MSEAEKRAAIAEFRRGAHSGPTSQVLLRGRRLSIGERSRPVRHDGSRHDGSRRLRSGHVLRRETCPVLATLGPPDTLVVRGLDKLVPNSRRRSSMEPCPLDNFQAHPGSEVAGEAQVMSWCFAFGLATADPLAAGTPAIWTGAAPPSPYRRPLRAPSPCDPLLSSPQRPSAAAQPAVWSGGGRAAEAADRDGRRLHHQRAVVRLPRGQEQVLLPGSALLAAGCGIRLFHPAPLFITLFHPAPLFITLFHPAQARTRRSGIRTTSC